MTLENELKKNTAALEALTEALLAGGGVAAADTPATEKKTAANTESKAAETKAPTPEEAAKVVTAYLKEGSPEDREKARANVGKIVEHFKAERFTVISDLTTALDMLNDFQEGRTPEALAAEDSGDLV